MNPKKLKELLTLDSSLRRSSWIIYRRFLEKLLRNTRIPQSDHCLDLLNADRFSEMVEYAGYLSSTEYKTAGEHRLCNQIAAVIRKYPYPEGVVSFDPEGKATKLFLSAEHKCRRVNQRFSAYRKVRSPNELVLSYARSYVHYVLGELNLPKVYENSGFSAGASLGVHGSVTNLARKFLSEEWTVTPGAYHYARAMLKDDIHFFELLCWREGSAFFSLDPDLFNKGFDQRAKLVDYNKISFVPKTVEVHRTMAVEPLLNGYLQKGVDQVMKQRLKRVGIDLTDQTRNQELALQGSLDWKAPDGWCTIDLSSASDCVATEVVRYLLPPDWFDFLNSIRSKSYKMNGKVKPFHKFATMGNGFCFPLETLVFASLCHAACISLNQKPEYSVYGDDIIVRANVFDRVVQLLKLCGFTTNLQKTFSTGPFRESCGADYWEGEDVRPITLDYAFDSLECIFKFCNICRSKDRWNVIFGESLEYLESLIPSSLMFVRPYKGNPDSCLEVPWDTFMASRFASRDRKTGSWRWVEVVKSAAPDKGAKRIARYEIALMKGATIGVLASTPFAERFTARTKLKHISTGGCESTLKPSGHAWRHVSAYPRVLNTPIV